MKKFGDVFIYNQVKSKNASTSIKTIDKLNEKFGKVLVTPATNKRALESDDRIAMSPFG